MNSFSFRIVAVVVLFPLAISVAALPYDTEWAPIQTRSQPVPFAPEFYGQYSDAARPEIIRSIAAIRRRLFSRSHQAHSESSPFASSPKIASVGSDESQFYVVFSTPVDETTLSVFKEFTGRPLLSYIGENSFLAVGSEGWAAKARLFPGVVTASPRSSLSKVSPEMRRYINTHTSAAAASRGAATSADQVRSLALCYGAVGCRHALASVAHLSCTTYLHADILEMHCPPRDAEAAVTAAASSAGVYWIEPKSVIATRNWSGKSIIGTGQSQTWGGANPFKVFYAVSLQDSIIGFADSGVSRNNCFFCNLNNAGACDVATGSTPARNIFKYWFLPKEECAKCGNCGTAAPGTQVAQACGNDYDEDGHGTHVAGTIAGSSNLAADTTPSTLRNNGVAGASVTGANARGARLFFQDIQNKVTDAQCAAAGLSAKCGDGLNVPTDINDLFTPAYDANVRIHSNSWGCANEKSSDGQQCNNYDSQAQAIDRFVASKGDFLVLVAAGNDGASSLDQTVGAPATCKNCLAVGASEINSDQLTADKEYVSNDNTGTSANNLASFSSRGPTRHDGRFKPDLVAPGATILSMSAADKDTPTTGPVNYCDVGKDKESSAEQALLFKDGTSMATPLVAGAMEYVRQYFLQGFYPTGAAIAGNKFSTVPEALLRGVILAGSRQIKGKVTISSAATDLPSSYPNYAIGFGLPVVDRALYMAGGSNGLQIINPLPSFSAGASAPHLYQFKCGASSSDTAVHVVLTWTDPAGNPVAMKQIVNDLDLVVVPPNAAQVFGNNGDFADTSNTVEKVALSACGASGQVVRVAVSPGRVLSTQAYALVVNGNVEMDSLFPLSAGSFAFKSTRPASIKYSTFPLTSCQASVLLPVVSGRSPLGSSPTTSTAFVRTFASRRVSAALAMFLGVSLSAFTATWSQDLTALNLTISCSSYVCGSGSSMCYVSAVDIVSALNTRGQDLQSLPLSSPLSAFNWGNFTAQAAQKTQQASAAAPMSSRFLLLLSLLFLSLLS